MLGFHGKYETAIDVATSKLGKDTFKKRLVQQVLAKNKNNQSGSEFARYLRLQGKSLLTTYYNTAKKRYTDRLPLSYINGMSYNKDALQNVLNSINNTTVEIVKAGVKAEVTETESALYGLSNLYSNLNEDHKYLLDNNYIPSGITFDYTYRIVLYSNKYYLLKEIVSRNPVTETIYVEDPGGEYTTAKDVVTFQGYYVTKSNGTKVYYTLIKFDPITYKEEITIKKHHKLTSTKHTVTTTTITKSYYKLDGNNTYTYMGTVNDVSVTSTNGSYTASEYDEIATTTTNIVNNTDKNFTIKVAATLYENSTIDYNNSWNKTNYDRYYVVEYKKQGKLYLWIYDKQTNKYPSLYNTIDIRSYDIPTFPIVCLRNNFHDITEWDTEYKEVYNQLQEAINTDSTEYIEAENKWVKKPDWITKDRYYSTKRLIKSLGVSVKDILEQINEEENSNKIKDVFFMVGVIPNKDIKNSDTHEYINRGAIISKILYETFKYIYDTYPLDSDNQYLWNIEEETFNIRYEWTQEVAEIDKIIGSINTYTHSYSKTTLYIEEIDDNGVSHTVENGKLYTMVLEKQISINKVSTITVKLATEDYTYGFKVADTFSAGTYVWGDVVPYQGWQDENLVIPLILPVVNKLTIFEAMKLTDYCFQIQFYIKYKYYIPWYATGAFKTAFNIIMSIITVCTMGSTSGFQAAIQAGMTVTEAAAQVALNILIRYAISIIISVSIKMIANTSWGSSLKIVAVIGTVIAGMVATGGFDFSNMSIFEKAASCVMIASKLGETATNTIVGVGTKSLQKEQAALQAEQDSFATEYGAAMYKFDDILNAEFLTDLNLSSNYTNSDSNYTGSFLISTSMFHKLSLESHLNKEFDNSAITERDFATTLIIGE